MSGSKKEPRDLIEIAIDLGAAVILARSAYLVLDAAYADETDPSEAAASVLMDLKAARDMLDAAITELGGAQ